MESTNATQPRKRGAITAKNPKCGKFRADVAEDSEVAPTVVDDTSSITDVNVASCKLGFKFSELS